VGITSFGKRQLQRDRKNRIPRYVTLPTECTRSSPRLKKRKRSILLSRRIIVKLFKSNSHKPQAVVNRVQARTRGKKKIDNC